MKNIFTILCILSILSVPVFSNAQQNQQGKQVQQGIHEPGTGLEDPELKQANQGTGQGLKGQNERAVSRRSRVANAVQEMEKIANRNKGIGNQVRVIAQNQNRIQEEAEGALQVAQKRNGFTKFLIGPNYKQLKIAEEGLENNIQDLAELKELKEQIQDSVDKSSLEDQIKIMEEIKKELKNEVAENKSGFSLFGWLARIFAE